MDVLGIDIAKQSFDATLLTADGSQHYAAFTNSAEGFEQLAAWLEQHQLTTLHACMEATNVYWLALATWLHAAGHTVSVVNPLRIKGYALAMMQRNKTDKLDSAVIAAFCAKECPSAWEPQSEEQQRLRALVRHRQDLLQTQLQQQNRLRDAGDELVRSSLQSLLKAIEGELESVEQRIKEHLKTQASLQANLLLLTSIVGIAEVTASRLLAELADIEQYHSAKAVAADAGLNPSQHESGSSVRRRPKLSKLGKAGIRAALWWPAISAMRYCPGFKAFAERLAKRGKAKKVIIGAVMRKLLHVCYGVLKHQTPYDPAKAFGHTARGT
jgi:transposase